MVERSNVLAVLGSLRVFKEVSSRREGEGRKAELLRLLLAISDRAFVDLVRRTVLLGESDLREALAGLGLRSGGYAQPCIVMRLGMDRFLSSDERKDVGQSPTRP
jgi:hypothetical protein